MEGCAANTTTLDLVDVNGAVLKTNGVKGSALLQHFVQQSEQNTLDERKAVRNVLDSTLTETGSNDDLITELEFTETLSGLSKDTIPGAGIMEADDRRVTTVFTVQPSFHHRHSTNRVS